MQCQLCPRNDDVMHVPAHAYPHAAVLPSSASHPKPEQQCLAWSVTLDSGSGGRDCFGGLRPLRPHVATTQHLLSTGSTKPNKTNQNTTLETPATGSLLCDAAFQRAKPSTPSPMEACNKWGNKVLACPHMWANSHLMDPTGCSLPAMMASLVPATHIPHPAGKQSVPAIRTSPSVAMLIWFGVWAPYSIVPPEWTASCLTMCRPTSGCTIHMTRPLMSPNQLSTPQQPHACILL